MNPPHTNAATLDSTGGPNRSSSETSLPIHTTGWTALGSSRSARSSANAINNAPASRYHSPGHTRHSIILRPSPSGGGLGWVRLYHHDVW